MNRRSKRFPLNINDVAPHTIDIALNRSAKSCAQNALPLCDTTQIPSTICTILNRANSIARFLQSMSHINMKDPVKMLLLQAPLNREFNTNEAVRTTLLESVLSKYNRTLDPVDMDGDCAFASVIQCLQKTIRNAKPSSIQYIDSLNIPLPN